MNFVNKLLRSRLFIFLLRLPFALAFIGIILSGLFGSVYRNAAMLTVGVVWLVFISLAAILAGKLWCLVCPWNALAEWIQKLFAIRSSSLAAPKIFRNLWLAVFLFILIIWLEYTIALTDQARLIAYLALCIFAVTFVSGLFFAGKSFCRYGCPVGAICGLYGFFAPLELRSSDKNTCRECRTKDCIKGNQNGGPCPVFEYPGAMDDNLYCIFCVECISACPNDNISVNARKPAVDLLKFKALSFSEMFMVVTMLALSVFGAINISSVHLRIIEWASVKLHLPEAASLLLLMLALMAGFLLVIYALAGLYRTGPSPVSYVLLPVALFNHMANTVKLFSIRAEEAIPLVSDPFGLSWNLFGTAGHLSKPFFAPETLSIIIAPLMLIGLIYSIYLLMSLRKSHAFSLPSAVYGLLVVFGLVWLNWWLIPQ